MRRSGEESLHSTSRSASKGLERVVRDSFWSVGDCRELELEFTEVDEGFLFGGLRFWDGWFCGCSTMRALCRLIFPTRASLFRKSGGGLNIILFFTSWLCDWLKKNSKNKQKQTKSSFQKQCSNIVRDLEHIMIILYKNPILNQNHRKPINQNLCRPILLYSTL